MIGPLCTPHSISPQTQGVNWAYIRRSEDVQDVFWMSYVRSIYVLCLRACLNNGFWQGSFVRICWVFNRSAWTKKLYPSFFKKAFVFRFKVIRALKISYQFFKQRAIFQKSLLFLEEPLFFPTTLKWILCKAASKRFPVKTKTKSHFAVKLVERNNRLSPCLLC